MFELFKKRSFSDYISDTITFFKINGKHFFKNYFTINGIPLLILMVLMYFFSKIYSEILTGSLGQNTQSSAYLEHYFNNNVGLFIVVIIALLLLSILLYTINFTYPIVYLLLYEERGSTDFSLSDVLQVMKQNMGRIIAFMLGLTFIIFPILMIAMVINVLLCFIIIGIFLFFITIPASMSWIYLSYYEYLIKKASFFEAIGNGFSLVKQQFWKTVGTTLIMAILLYIIQSIISMIPYVAAMFSLYGTGNSFGQPGDTSATNSFTILMSIYFMVSVLVGSIFNNFQLICQGLIYYSLREESEENTTKSQIDLIGTDSE